MTAATRLPYLHDLPVLHWGSSILLSETPSQSMAAINISFVRSLQLHSKILNPKFFPLRKYSTPPWCPLMLTICISAHMSNNLLLHLSNKYIMILVKYWYYNISLQYAICTLPGVLRTCSICIEYNIYQYRTQDINTILAPLLQYHHHHHPPLWRSRASACGATLHVITARPAIFIIGILSTTHTHRHVKDDAWKQFWKVDETNLCILSHS